MEEGRGDVQHTACLDVAGSLAAEDIVLLGRVVGASLVAGVDSRERKVAAVVDHADVEALSPHGNAGVNVQVEEAAYSSPVQIVQQLDCGTDIHWAQGAHHMPSLESSTSLVVVAVEH